MNLYQKLSTEIILQKTLISESEEILKYAPEGRLFIRPRRKSRSYYRIRKIKTDTGWKDVAENINKNPNMVMALTEKKIAEEQLRICRTNLKALEKLIKQVHPYELDDIIEKLPAKYFEAWKMYLEKLRQEQEHVEYIKAQSFADSHIHVTINGLLVRSKSEMIIANLLYSMGIPFNYEERFPVPYDDGKYIYPDFTIHLPDGSVIYWEHLGMLNMKSYCERNATKLHHYQMNEVYIGKNLILTQDDKHGNCDSAFIAELIKTYILPHFA